MLCINCNIFVRVIVAPNIANYLNSIIAYIANPITTRYIAKILKLPFLRNFIRKPITKIPAKKLANTPQIKATLNSKSGILTSTAAATIGAESKNENLAADSRSTPDARATVMVIPDLETPGKAAASA